MAPIPGFRCAASRNYIPLLSRNGDLSKRHSGLTAFRFFVNDDVSEGIEWARRGKEENPDWPGAYRVLTASCGQAGRIEEGRAAVAEPRRVAPEMTIESTRAQVPWKDPADRERYLEGLRKAGLPES